MSKKQIVIGVTHDGEITSEMANFLFQVSIPEDYTRFTLESKGHTAEARNELIQLALEREEVEWFFFLDQYQSLDPWALEHLFEVTQEEDIKVLTPIVFAYRFKLPVPVTHDIHEEVRFDNIISSGVYEMPEIPTKCLLVHRDVIEDIDPPWFEEKTYQNKVVDSKFSQKCKDAGYDLYMTEDVIADNMKEIDLADYYNAIEMAIDNDREEIAEELHAMIWSENLNRVLN